MEIGEDGHKTHRKGIILGGHVLVEIFSSDTHKLDICYWMCRRRCSCRREDGVVLVEEEEVKNDREKEKKKNTGALHDVVLATNKRKKN